MRKFSSILAIFLISVTIVTLFSMVGVAQQNDIQVTLKSKNLGPDPSFGGSRATITLTVNKIGDLVYIEEYFGTDGSGQPKLYQAGRYEPNMSGYTVTFDVNRPSTKRGQYWSTINATVRLDGVTIYQTPISTSGTYRSFTGRAVWYNNSVIDIGKGRPSIQQKQPFNPTGEVAVTGGAGNVSNNDNGTKIIVPEKSPAIEVSVVIAVLFSVYMCFQISNKKNRK